ncbi:MAG: bifunctional UDP-sugar hydrolase/5'-nucleotidase [Bacteroidota bacterium]
MKIFTIVLFVVSNIFAQQTTLTILHWNDFHSQNLPFQVKSRNRVTNTDTTFFVGGSATLSSYLKKYKAESPNVLLLHGGDDFQGTPISSITKGKSQVELLNLLHPDVMQLGNHEFDYGREQVTKYLQSFNFPVLGANMFDTRTKQTYAKQYVIKQIGNVKVGIIGLMSMELPTLSLPDNVKDIELKALSQTVKDLVPELKKQNVDLIIALTHIGADEDSVLALNTPDLDIIVGGHSHTPLFRPKRVNGILITQAGSRGRWLGKIDLTVDTEKDTVILSKAELIECRTADIAPDSIVAAKVQEFEQLATSELSEIIGELKTDWKRDGRGESNLGNWICDAVRVYAKTDVCLQNSGGIRKELLAGKITVRDLWEISPFGNTIVTFIVDGTTLRRMVQHQLSLNDDFCQISGMKVVFRNNNGERILHNLKVNNVLVKDTQKYSIATNNFVAAQSKKYFGIELPSVEITQLNITDRDVLIEAVKKQKVINSQIEGRIKETEE